MHAKLTGVVCLLCAAHAGGAFAAETAEEGLKGEVELGWVATSGNTETQSFNGKAKAIHERDQWRNTFRLEALNSQDEDETTSERYFASAKTDYRYTEYDYWFGNLRYENDRFSGYDYTASETAGYGRRVMERPALTLDLEAGLGGRHRKPEGASRDDEAIVIAAGALVWEISENAGFSQDARIEHGSDNTYTESVSALTTRINSRFSMKAAVTLKHNSDVPEGNDKTDTMTAVTLVYDF